jgi:hypothetical protein
MYLVDADVLIQAKNAHYGFDFVPAFWDWMEGAHQAGLVFSVEAVGEEIAAGADELAEWAARLPTGFFLGTEAFVVPHLEFVANWANSNGQYRQGAVREFLDAGDYHLVAQARARRFTVVTHETSEPNAVRRIKIPDACSAVGVAVISPWELLRREGARFVL